MIGAGVFSAFGRDEIAELVGGVRSAVASRPSASAAPSSVEVGADDLIAGGIWSVLVEPGDATGAVLREVFGAAGALAVLALGDAEVTRRLEAAGCENASRIDLTAARKRWAPRTSLTTVRSAFRFAASLGIRLLVPGDPEWPRGFDDLGLHAPAALWVRGDAGALVRRPSVALVGCRAASAYGEQVAAELSAGLVTRGFSVVSGGAYGIDGMAHRSALASGGQTTAIMAGGVDRFYPAGHHDLLQRVSETGVVVGEVACGTPPSRWRFLQRNRLLAALSAATVVVEAGHRSGALNTVTHARSLGRPIGAVPGPVTSPASAGCHRLLRDGDVTCITGVDDVLSLVDPRLTDALESFGPGRDAPREMRVLDALSTRRGRTEAELAERGGLADHEVRAVLAVLELEGRAAERDTGWVRRDAGAAG